MCSNVKVSGIPAPVKFRKLISLFSNILSMKNSDFILHLLPVCGPVKDVLLRLPTQAEAQLAQEKLDNFVYKYNNVPYIFTAILDGHRHQNNKSRQKSKFRYQNFRQSYGNQCDSRYEEGYHRDRSRSPHYRDECSQLDMQIEILKKQRMIIEEERKLLEEQRKLDLLKMETFCSETPSVFNTTYDEDIMSGLSSNQSEKKFEPTQLSFHHASGVLMKKMNMFIQKYSSPDERTALLTNLRSILKKRLAAVVAAKGQGVYQTNKVIMLYRMQYPPSTDGEVVKEALKDITEGGLTSDTDAVKTSFKEANAKNDPDGTKSVAGDHTLKEGNTNATDTTLSGESDVSEIIKNKDEEKSKKKFQEKRLFFHKSSGVLIRKMNVHIIKHCQPETRRIFVEYLRSTLKQRLAAVVDGQHIYQTHKIMKLYRLKHPANEDEDLVIQLIKDIEKKAENTASEENSAAIVNITSQENIINKVEANDESGKPDNKDFKDVYGNVGNEENEEKNIENTKNDSHDDLRNDLVSENTKNDTTKTNICDNSNTDNDKKTEILATEVTLKCIDNVEVKEGIVTTEPILKLRNDLVSENTENDTTKTNICDNSNTDNDKETEILATEATLKCIDNVEVKEGIVTTEAILKLRNDLVSENTENDTTKTNICDNSNKDNDKKTEILATEVTLKCIDNVEVKSGIVTTEATLKCIDNVEVNTEEDNGGIKRKSYALENSCVKVAKTSK